MSLRPAISAALLLALGACGGDKPVDGANLSIANANLDVTTGDAACSQRPPHAPVYADASYVTCAAGAISATSKVSGTVVYETAAAPAAVLAWSKAEAIKAGLTEQLSSADMISATEGDRTVMVMAQPRGSGSMVTVNWGRAP